ncbi:MAG: methyltransferase domain-containing protein, partial [Chthoniobacterales bacterium]
SVFPWPADFEDPEPFSIEDEKFDLIYPTAVRQLSSIFWTPVAVAAEAADLLVTKPGVRVLDVGCGAGKFCLVGAAVTEGIFTGVEQRLELLTAARAAALELNAEVEFVHGNVVEVAFADYDAFYIFNPFEENMHGHQIDSEIPLSPALFRKYTRHVAEALGAQPQGTRVVTYMGYAEDIPACYECEATRFRGDLKLWIKRREYDAAVERPKLRPGA